MTEHTFEFVTFYIESQRFAIPVTHVEKALRAVAVKPVPEAGELLYGVFNYRGQPVPAVNLRRKLAFDTKSITPEQRFLIVSTPERRIALVVDEVGAIITAPEKKMVGVKEIEGIAGQKEGSYTSLYIDDEGIVIIYDLDGLLSGDLDKELKKLANHFSERQKG